MIIQVVFVNINVYEGGRELSGKLKPASTHALSVSLAPAGTRHRSHISRTISHP